MPGKIKGSGVALDASGNIKHDGKQNDNRT